MSKEEITITSAEFDEAVEKVADILAGKAVDERLPHGQAMFAMHVSAMSLRFIKNILFKEEDNGD